MLGWFKRRPKTMTFTCSCCGEEVSGSPSFRTELPIYYYEVPEEEREARVTYNDELCRVQVTAGEESEDDIYAIRVSLDIPIHGVAQPFHWGLWVTQSKEDFYRYYETMTEEDQIGEVTFGWLAVTMPYYRRTSDDEFLELLACDVIWQFGARPKILLHKSDHPLYRDQRDGISWKKAVKIANLQRQRHHSSD
jgi:hypothetical protein